MKLMLHLIALSTFILCFCCKAKENSQSNNQITTPVIIDKSLTKIFDMSHKIDTAFVNGDILTLKISFFNVCKTDTFELVGNGKFAKSNPPLTGLFIRRKASNVDCKTNLTKELKFDVSALKYPLLNKVILNLDEQNKVIYTY
jgi:hypothetical protein